MDNQKQKKKCKQCLSDIPKDARKCPQCRSLQPEEHYRKYLLLVVGLLIIIFIMISNGEEETNLQEKARKNAIHLYEQMITDNVVNVIEKVPEYASNQRKICSYKDGFLIEDIYNAEWYVVGNKIFAVNGLAKSLTPDIDYAPAEISYQTCY